MQNQQYEEFTNQLQAKLAEDERVHGLVALGSMARQDYQPDQWSDHDFFVIVEDGADEEFRTNLSWLPGPEKIAIQARETRHGLKVIYNDGHLLEFAVFTLAELQMARVNRYRVLLDRGDVITTTLTKLAETSAQEASSRTDTSSLFGQFLANLLVGVGRHQRGEQLSGRQFVTGHALHHLLRLLAFYGTSPRASLLDNLDPLRRFEKVYPELGAELNALLLLPTPQAARQLLALAQRELAGKLPDYPQSAVEAVLALL